MKIALVAAVVVCLTSCNTMIGLGRDTKEGYYWTKTKIQESRQGGGHQDDYGAPVY